VRTLISWLIRQRTCRKAKKRVLEKLFPEITEREAALLTRIAPFTLTSPERQWALLKAVEYLNANSIPGDIVECGVWRGGSSMLAKELCHSSHINRKFYLFDTFTGMGYRQRLSTAIRSDESMKIGVLRVSTRSAIISGALACSMSG
jgi:hypothetical protein